MILKKNDHSELYDYPITLKCPHCTAITGLTLLSIPNFEYLKRFTPSKIGMGFMCNACNEPVFLKFKVLKYDTGNYKIHISKNYEEIEHPKETFEFEYLPKTVKCDLEEAFNCYSNGAYNAFASMCRRTIQSSASEIGAKGKDKVQKQIREMKEIAELDEETYDLIKQVILDGHDGAHPHLPTLSPERATVLLELIKDVMYQLFVRKGKLKEAKSLRKNQIQSSKSGGEQ